MARGHSKQLNQIVIFENLSKIMFLDNIAQSKKWIYCVLTTTKFSINDHKECTKSLFCNNRCQNLPKVFEKNPYLFPCPLKRYDFETLCRNCSQFRYIWSEIADYSNMQLNKNMWSVEKKTNLNWELRTSIQSFVHATSITTHTHTHARLYQRCSRGNFLAMNHCHFRDSVKLDQLVRARDCQSRGRRFASGNNSKKSRTQIYMDLSYIDPQARVLNYCYK